jgi:hypothetical protein
MKFRIKDRKVIEVELFYKYTKWNEGVATQKNK